MSAISICTANAGRAILPARMTKDERRARFPWGSSCWDHACATFELPSGDAHVMRVMIEEDGTTWRKNERS